jgi:hypothetical protein
LQHPRLQSLLAKGVRGLHDGAFVIGELLVQQKRVVPLEAGFHGDSPKEGRKDV